MLRHKVRGQAKMTDNWQKHVYNKCSAFIGEDFKYEENEVSISLNQREAYVVMKALEVQEKVENPMMIVEEEKDDRD